MAGPIDVIQRALSALASAGLGSESPAEAYVLGYQAGWREAGSARPVHTNRNGNQQRNGGNE